MPLADGRLVVAGSVSGTIRGERSYLLGFIATVLPTGQLDLSFADSGIRFFEEEEVVEITELSLTSLPDNTQVLVAGGSTLRMQGNVGVLDAALLAINMDGSINLNVIGNGVRRFQDFCIPRLARAGVGSGGRGQLWGARVVQVSSLHSCFQRNASDAAYIVVDDLYSGLRDSNFADSGVFRINVSSLSWETLNNFLIMPTRDGHLLVTLFVSRSSGGSSGPTEYDVILFKLDRSGNLVPEFGGSGYVDLVYDWAQTPIFLEEQTDGKLLIAARPMGTLA